MDRTESQGKSLPFSRRQNRWVFWMSTVAEESARGALAGNVVEMGKSGDLVYCPACGGDRMYRLERKGILQKKMFPFFGFYPWQCKECGAEALLRKRKRRRRKRTAV
jgi:predicted RNA-binding Zn-ribbon protein involved in translation (DUF1610 family)